MLISSIIQMSMPYLDQLLFISLCSSAVWWVCRMFYQLHLQTGNLMTISLSYPVLSYHILCSLLLPSSDLLQALVYRILTLSCIFCQRVFPLLYKMNILFLSYRRKIMMPIINNRCFYHNLSRWQFTNLRFSVTIGQHFTGNNTQRCTVSSCTHLSTFS